MIERVGLTYELICDECGETVNDLSSFDDALEYLHDSPWETTKVQGVWENLCPGCKKDHDDANMDDVMSRVLDEFDLFDEE